MIILSLVAEFLGYKTYILLHLILNKDHPVIDVNDIYLESKAVALQNVVISGKPKFIENKIDKLVFNAEQDLTSQVGVAMIEQLIDETVNSDLLIADAEK